MSEWKLTALDRPPENAGKLQCPECKALWPDNYDASCCDCGYEVDKMFPAGSKARQVATEAGVDEIQRDKYVAELAACAEIVQKVYLGGNSGIGLLNVAEALREIFAECAGDGLHGRATGENARDASQSG